jgi:hypothetical protein
VCVFSAEEDSVYLLLVARMTQLALYIVCGKTAFTVLRALLVFEETYVDNRCRI